MRLHSLTRGLIAATATVVGLLSLTTSAASAIVGGQDATQTYPGMTFVAVQYPGIGTAQCGGSLITPSIVLTAEHCLADEFAAPDVVAVPAEHVSFHIGSNDRTTGGFEATASKILLNPVFSWLLPTGLPPWDFALVKLAKPVPARLMPLGVRHVDPGDTDRAIGWGLTTFPVPPGYPLPTMLQQRDITVLPASDCAGGAIGVGEICVSEGPCFGESGGPLLAHAWDRWKEVGLTSRESTDPEDPDANPCAAPVIYTDLTYPPFREWIAETIRTERSQPCSSRVTVRSLSPATRNRINRLKPQLSRS